MKTRIMLSLCCILLSSAFAVTTSAKICVETYCRVIDSDCDYRTDIDDSNIELSVKDTSNTATARYNFFISNSSF